jgi:hypothetical protein
VIFIELALFGNGIHVRLTAAYAIEGERRWALACKRPQACKSRCPRLRPGAGRSSRVFAGACTITHPYADSNSDPIPEPYAAPQSDADIDINQFRPVGRRDRD